MMLVETRGLTKRYGHFTALADFTVEVPQGEVCGLLGPNGAGKTTLLRSLMGFMRPTGGSAKIAGYDAYRQRVEAHKQLAYLPGDPRLFRWLRGKAVLKFFADVRPRGDFAKAMQVAQRLDLDLKRRVAFMSTGMRQKLALAVVMSTDVPLLILDEPTSNLDPNVRDEVGLLVQEAKAAGRTVLFSSHVLSEVEEVCDRVLIMRAGRLMETQDMATLRSQHRIRARLEGPAPQPPPSLQDKITLRTSDGRLTIDVPGELSPVLAWLGTLAMTEMRIEPVGLKPIYDAIHPRNGATHEPNIVRRASEPVE